MIKHVTKTFFTSVAREGKTMVSLNSGAMHEHPCFAYGAKHPFKVCVVRDLVSRSAECRSVVVIIITFNTSRLILS